MDPQVIKGISTICYDELVQGIIKLIQRLDLGYTLDTAAGPDLIQQLKPNKIKDFVSIFCK